MNLGYACINMTLSGQKPKVTTNRSMIKRTFLERGVEYATELGLQNARDLYTRRNEGSCIWVVKSEYIVSSVPEDEDSFFDPSNDKVYRHPTFYKMPDGSKHI